MFEGLANRLIMVPGATAYGLVNKDSKTKAGAIFSEALNAHKDSFQIFCLGEVDCNALIWKREISIPRFVVKSTNNYINFVKHNSLKPIVCSVPLPPVESYQQPPYSLRKDKPRGYVKADKKHRTQVVNFFNSRLKTLCTVISCPFINLTPHIQNGEGLLNMKFSRSPADSHLNGLVEPILRKLLNEAKSFYHN